MKIKSQHRLLNTLANTNLVRKPCCIKEVTDCNRNYPFAEVVLITEVRELTVFEYKDFMANFNSVPEFSGKDEFVKYRGVYLRPVTALCCDGKPTFLVNSGGTDYAYYIGLHNIIA